MPYVGVASAETQDAFQRVLARLIDVLREEFEDELEDELGAVTSALLAVVGECVQQQPAVIQGPLVDHLCDELKDRALNRPPLIDPGLDPLERRQ
jgi:hypothetical protein